MAESVGKPVVLWQIPVGNMAQNNTHSHYRADNGRVRRRKPDPQDDRLSQLGRYSAQVGGGANAGCVTKTGAAVSSRVHDGQGRWRTGGLERCAHSAR
jgi:hypothetical protein